MKMTRILTLIVAACLVFGAGTANAKEMKFQGQFEQSLQWLNGSGLQDSDSKGDSEDDFTANQRIRMYFEYISSETLRGVVAFEINTAWGSPASTEGGGALGTDGTNVGVLNAYVDFNVGDVNVRTGLQSLDFPSEALGNPIFSGDVSAAIANYQFNDMVGLTAAWTRLLDNTTGSETDNYNDEVDAFTVMLPITAEGWTLTPYAIYAHVGKETFDGAGGALSSLHPATSTSWQDDVDVFWAGGAFKLELLDPFVLGVDVIYGDASAENNANDKTGWFAAAALDYKMDAVTPGLILFYGSGNDDDATDGSEAMPTFSADDNGGFAASPAGFAGSHWTTNESVLVSGGNFGMWGIGLTLKDFSFIENLTHTFTVLYGQGTNDADGVTAAVEAGTYLTDEDSFWDVELCSEYALYENMSIWSEMAYIHADLDEDTWHKDDAGNYTKLAVGISYNF